MAKDVTKEDDDDKFEKMDDESLSFLEQVRKGKSRNFVLSMKGNKVRSMVVKKKPIKEKERKAARGEGFQPIFGVASGMGAKITFTIARADGFDEKAAERKTEKLKKFLSSQTGKVFKPTFELVDSPPPIPFDDDDLSDPLIDRFMKMEPLIQTACDAHPESIPEIQAFVNTIRLLLEDDETRQQASPKIDQLQQFLEGLMSGNSPIDSPTQDPVEQAAKLAAALKSLKPLVDQVINVDPNQKGDLHTTMVRIAGEIKARQFDVAKESITTFAKQLKSLASGQPTASASETIDRSTEYAARRAALEPRLIDAQKADRDKATKLGAVWDYAGEQAGNGNFDNALTALSRLEAAINELLGANAGSSSSTASVDPDKTSGENLEAFFRRRDILEPRFLEAKRADPEKATKLAAVWDYANAQAQDDNLKNALTALGRLEKAVDELLSSPTQSDADRFGIDSGIVEKRKFLVTRFKQIPIEIKPHLDAVVLKISDRNADADPDELATEMETALQAFYDELQGEIDDCINAGDASRISGLKSRVSSNELVNHLIKNPFTDGTRFQTAILAALDEVEQKLAG